MTTRCLGVGGVPCGRRVSVAARKGRCPECLREHDRRRNAISPSVRRVVIARADGLCEIRGPRCTTRATTVDHIVPLSRGGSDAIDNLRAACGPCNYGRGNRG